MANFRLTELTPSTNEDNKLQVVGIEKCVLKKVKEDEESTTAFNKDPKQWQDRTSKIGVAPETSKLQVNCRRCHIKY